MSERQILFGWEFLVDIKPARSGAPVISCGAGTGSTSAGTTSQEFYARCFDARRVPSVAFPVGPAFVDQSTDDEHGVAFGKVGGCSCEVTPGSDVDEVRAFLVVAGTVAEAFVHSHAEAGDGMAGRRVPQFGIPGQVADDPHFVERVLQPGLITRVHQDGLAAAGRDVKQFDPVGIYVEAAALLAFRGFPGAVVEPALYEHALTGLRQLVDHVLGLLAEQGRPVVPGKAAFLAVITDNVVAAGQVEFKDGETPCGVAQFGLLGERAHQKNTVKSSCHLLSSSWIRIAVPLPASAGWLIRQPCFQSAVQPWVPSGFSTPDGP